jgi:hypothetical protein
MLNLTAGRGAVTFLYSDDNMTASWTVKTEDGEEKLINTMRKVIAFVEGEVAREPLPQRTPGVALEMAQMTHPAPVDPDAPVPYMPTNGWAAMPPIPPRLEGEVEFIPPEEQG